MKGCERILATCVRLWFRDYAIFFSSFSVSTRSFPSPSLLPSVLLWYDAVKSLPSIFFVLPLSKLCREQIRYISVIGTSSPQLSHHEKIDRPCVRRHRRHRRRRRRVRCMKEPEIFVDRITGIPFALPMQIFSRFSLARFTYPISNRTLCDAS